MTNYQVFSFEDKAKDLSLFIDDIERVYTLRYGVFDDYRLYLLEKLYSFKHALSDKVISFDGFVFYIEDAPMAICYVEKTTPFYGTLFVHAFTDDAGAFVKRYLDDKGFFDQTQLELSTIHSVESYLSFFRQDGLTENIRKRMSRFLDPDSLLGQEDHSFTFRQMTKDDLELTGQMSFEAHQVSRDYYMYVEMNQLEKRIALEKKAFDQLYGPVIEPASLIMYDKDRAIGNCLVVEVESWGYPCVPWVFDINIIPDYQKKGLGKILLKQVINVLIDMEYRIMGLAVTANNFAEKLYLKLGFESLDLFYEFTREKT